MTEKRRFDVLHQWWAARHGGRLTQWDAFSILLHRYLELDPDVPGAVRGMMDEVG